MQKHKNDYDEAMQEYARNWMKSLDRPRYTTNISIFFLAIFTFMWTSSLTGQLGYTPFRGAGLIVALIIAAAIVFILLFANFILGRIGFPKPLRSALWFSALIGPYISIATYNNWNNPALSHISGVFSALLAFLISYGLDKALTREPPHIIDE